MPELCIPFNYSISNYTYFFLLNYMSKDHLLTTHIYYGICETESRPSYRSPLCISVIKPQHIYQVR